MAFGFLQLKLHAKDRIWVRSGSNLLMRGSLVSSKTEPAWALAAVKEQQGEQGLKSLAHSQSIIGS